MNEEVFLKLRQEREEARQTRQQAGPSAEALHRSALLEELSAAAERTRAEVVERKNVDAALVEWKSLQEKLQSSSDTGTLTAHEMKQWNKTLSDLQSLIESLRNSAKPAKKFAFSKKPTAAVSQSPAVEASETSTADSCSISMPVGGLVLEDLKDQYVMVPSARAVFIRRCTNCTFLALPTTGSFFLSECRNVRVYACCHQMRIKSCLQCDVYVWCRSTPVIESCDQMRFGPYSCWTGLTSSTVQRPDGAGLWQFATHADWATFVGEHTNLPHAQQSWRCVDDFHWLKQSQSPHWCAMDEADFQLDATPYSAAPTESACSIAESPSPTEVVR